MDGVLIVCPAPLVECDLIRSSGRVEISDLEARSYREMNRAVLNRLRQCGFPIHDGPYGGSPWNPKHDPSPEEMINRALGDCGATRFTIDRDEYRRLTIYTWK